MNQISIPNIIEEKNEVCNIRFKDLALPIGLLREVDCPSDVSYPEEVCDCISNDLYDKLLYNERRKKIRKKTKKNKPIKISLTLKNNNI